MIDPTAVYRHFRNPRGYQGETWMLDSPKGVCADQVRFEYPATFVLFSNTWAATEHALGLLRQAGFDDGDAARAYQALLSYTLGHAMLEAPYAALDPSQAAAELTANRLLYQSLPAGDYPNIAAVAPDLYGSLEEQFAYGLDRLLDGLGLAATAQRSGPPRTPSHAAPRRGGAPAAVHAGAPR